MATIRSKASNTQLEVIDNGCALNLTHLIRLNRIRINGVELTPFEAGVIRDWIDQKLPGMYRDESEDGPTHDADGKE